MSISSIDQLLATRFPYSVWLIIFGAAGVAIGYFFYENIYADGIGFFSIFVLLAGTIGGLSSIGKYLFKPKKIIATNQGMSLLDFSGMLTLKYFRNRRLWISEQEKLLKNKLPLSVQGRIFLPSDDYYLQYYQHQNRSEGLQYMATELFGWLGIRPNGCIIDFYDEINFPSQSGHTAGFYTKTGGVIGQKEVIFVNSKYKDDPLAVGAILAHEMLHLYLFRLKIEIDDVQKNELLTDLATIRTGLPVLILNGMSYSSEWYLTIIMIAFGRLYWSSQQLAFGYFKPRLYGKKVRAYLRENGLSVADILGYLAPKSIGFLGHFMLAKPKSTNSFIASLVKRDRIATLWQLLLVVIVVGCVAGYYMHRYNEKNNLEEQMSSCKVEISTLENEFTNDMGRLDSLRQEAESLKKQGNSKDYNNLVDTYNSFLKQVNNEKIQGSSKVDLCNKLINNYNSSN